MSEGWKAPSSHLLWKSRQQRAPWSAERVRERRVEVPGPAIARVLGSSPREVRGSSVGQEPGALGL